MQPIKQQPGGRSGLSLWAVAFVAAVICLAFLGFRLSG
jgi:hypothetical protein